MVKVCGGGEGAEVSGFAMRGFFGLRGKGEEWRDGREGEAGVIFLKGQGREFSVEKPGNLINLFDTW